MIARTVVAAARTAVKDMTESEFYVAIGKAASAHDVIELCQAYMALGVQAVERNGTAI